MQGMDQAQSAAYETKTMVREDSRIDVAASMISEAHDRLVHQIDRLSDRLRPVLQPENDAMMLREGGVDPSPPKSPHVLSLEAQATRANAMADQCVVTARPSGRVTASC